MGLTLSIKTRLALYSATIEAVICRAPKFSSRRTLISHRET